MIPPITSTTPITTIDIKPRLQRLFALDSASWECFDDLRCFVTAAIIIMTEPIPIAAPPIPLNIWIICVIAQKQNIPLQEPLELANGSITSSE